MTAERETPIPPGHGEPAPAVRAPLHFDLSIDFYPEAFGDGEFNAVLTIEADDERFEGATVRELFDRVADALARRGIR